MKQAPAVSLQQQAARIAAAQEQQADAPLALSQRAAAQV
jgi:hypothetical protein